MNGVVRPQHAPTIRKPMIQRKMDGCGSIVADVSEAIVAIVASKKPKIALPYSRNNEDAAL
jgi:hypothetical protein